MDSFTGTKMTRPEFDKLLEKLKAGDTLVVAKLDRFARSVSQASGSNDGNQQEYTDKSKKKFYLTNR